MPLYYQKPGSRLDYTVSFASLLGAGDSLDPSKCDWTVTPSTGVLLTGEDVSSPEMSVFVAGLTDGATYALKADAESVQGRKDSDTITLVCAKPPASAGEILSMLPDDTAVTFQEVQGFVGEGASKIAANHADNMFPYSPVAEALVSRYAHARALKHHFMKGEAFLDTPGVDKDLDRLEKEFAAYDAEHTTPDEPQATVVISSLPW